MAITPVDIITRATKALANKVYAETLNAFLARNVFMELVTKRTIKNGKSAQFILTGKLDETDVQTHVPGTITAETDYGVGETTITIGAMLYNKKIIDKYEEKMAHYSIRNPLTTMMGQSLAIDLDKKLVAALQTAWAVTPALTGQVVSGTVLNAVIGSGGTAELRGDAILDAIFQANAALDDNDVTGDRYFVTTNANYYDLLQSAKAVNRDFNDGTNGSIKDGNVFKIGDVMVLRSNNLDVNAGGGAEVTEGWVFTKSAIGMVELIGMNTDQWFDKDYRGTKMIAELAYGIGTLDTTPIVKITSAAIA